jgi:hypothetical protein
VPVEGRADPDAGRSCARLLEWMAGRMTGPAPVPGGAAEVSPEVERAVDDWRASLPGAADGPAALDALDALSGGPPSGDVAAGFGRPVDEAVSVRCAAPPRPAARSGDFLAGQPAGGVDEGERADAQRDDDGGHQRQPGQVERHPAGADAGEAHRQRFEH